MLRHSSLLAGAITRIATPAAAVALIAGCGWDVADPLGPSAQPGPLTPAPALAIHPAAHEATNIQFGEFAMHVPANVHHVRGVLLALGGPDTRGFPLGTPFGAPFPEVEGALQELGTMFRDLAAERGLAILGSGRFGRSPYPNEPASDQLLFDAVAQAAALTGRPELTEAPLVVYGVSGGGPQATGLTQRNPGRVAALFLKVPVSAGPLTGQALSVPAYMVLAELDAFVNNAMLTATFQTHRAAGAPWAMALERGVPHHSLSPAQRELTVGWMRAILPIGAAGPFHANPPKVGWLGDPATGQISPVRAFRGDPSDASWFPTRPLADAWAAFIGY